MLSDRPLSFALSCRFRYKKIYLQSFINRYGTVTPAQSFALPPPSTFKTAIEAKNPRYNWTKNEISEIYNTPLMRLAFAAVSTRRNFYDYPDTG